MKAIKKFTALLAAAIIIFTAVPSTAFAADQRVKVSVSNCPTLYGSEKREITISAEPRDYSDPYKLIIESSDKDITFSTKSSGIYDNIDSQSFMFSVTVAKNAAAGNHNYTVKAVSAADETVVYGSVNAIIPVATGKDSFSSIPNNKANFSYSIDGGNSITSGTEGVLEITAFNRGNINLQNASITISFADGLSIVSGSSSASLGYFNTGDSKTVTFPIRAEKGLSSKSVTMSVKLVGYTSVKTNSYKDDTTGKVHDNYELKEQSYEETLYIPVVGVGEAGNTEIQITNVSIPQSAEKQKSFNLSFDVKNIGAEKAKDLKVSVNMPSGCVNTSANVFMVNELLPGASEHFTVSAQAKEGGEYQLFEIHVQELGEGGLSVGQYAGLMINDDGEGSGSAGTPILMVSNYSYGGSPVVSGSTFPLSITIKNTSTAESLKNIKVTVTSDNGSFIPSGTSNAYYVPAIGKGASDSHTINMSVNGDAQEGTSSLTVSMSYEDSDGKALSATDVISVPITQNTRFVVDEIMDPGYLSYGDVGYASVQFYNMGKNELRNLRVSYEGDFVIDGAASEFIGNMASGRDDSVSLRFIPNAEGPMNGKVIFTFEDNAGNETVVEKEFCFNINPAPNYDDFDDGGEVIDPGMAKTGPGWKTIAIAVVAVAAAAIIGRSVYKKRKMNSKELELDE